MPRKTHVFLYETQTHNHLSILLVFESVAPGQIYIRTDE